MVPELGNYNSAKILEYRKETQLIFPANQQAEGWKQVLFIPLLAVSQHRGVLQSIARFFHPFPAQKGLSFPLMRYIRHQFKGDSVRKA